MSPPVSHDYNSEFDIKYSQSSPLNTYDVHRPSGEAVRDLENAYWIIYVHGGAWRDPLQSSRNILPALPFLKTVDYPVGGIISLNYRLSEYPHHTTSPSSPNDKSRNAKHPDHIHDILTAINYTQHKYGFGENYIVAGHSCGATLTYQALMGLWHPSNEGYVDSEDYPAELKLPVAAVGIAGIYDLKLLLETHSDSPEYKIFLDSAFGTDQSKWTTPSPVNGKLREAWPAGKIAVLAQSREDVLIDWIQTERMSETLWREKRSGRRDVVIQLNGDHNDCWQQGDGVAKAIATALNMLKGAES